MNILESNSLRGKSILVPGGAGFLGKFLIPMLEMEGATVFIPKHSEYNLSKEDNVNRLFIGHVPDMVINLCGSVGGISHNNDHAADLFINNILPGIFLLDASSRAGVKKFVQIGSICEYPNHTPIPFKEFDVWNGYPDETNAPYGIAKRALLTYGQALRKQYSLNAVHVLLANLYGPGDDFTDSGHVIPGIIDKFMSGRSTLPGSGSPTREFLYVEDAARAIVMVAKYYDSPEPINVGSGEEISIADLAEIISCVTGFPGTIDWDTSKPNGQPRRCVDNSKIRKLGFVAKTDLLTGIKKTVDWYIKNKEAYLA